MELTNITELIPRDGMLALLRLCGDRQIGAACSDYEIFRAFCHAVPLLEGHPLPRSIHEALQRELGFPLKLAPDTCDRWWRACAESLVLNPRSQPLTLKAPVNEEWRPPAWRINQTALVLDGARLLHTEADSWRAWEREMRSALDEFCKAGGSVVRLVPTADACDRVPDLYHVEQALKRKEDNPVLTAQLFRCLAQELQKRDMTLWLDTDSCGARAVSLLAYAERCVGLPRLIWTCTDRDTFEALRDWQSLPHGFEMRFAVKDGISDGELREIARSYPIGRLWKLRHQSYGNGMTTLEFFEFEIREKSLDR